MIASPTGANKVQIPFISLVPFFLIAFGLAWGILALFIFLPKRKLGVGKMIRLCAKMQYAPTLSISVEK